MQNLLHNPRYRKVFLILVIVLLVFVNIFKRAFGMDFIILTLAIFALVYGESWKFVKDWLPPMCLFYLYEGVRAYAVNVHEALNLSPIVEPLIWLERKLFFFLDEVPSVKLQYALRHDLYVASWYDYILFFFYSTFFWYWLAAGFIIWVKRRELFKPYAYGLAFFSLFDVLIYMFFPSAPPWWASDNGYIPEIHRILWHNDYLPSKSMSVVSTYGRNDFAAFPSHHVAWPFYATLFLVYIFGKKALPLFIVPIMIAFATWYGAEHYVIDSLAGCFVASVTFLIAINYKDLLKKVSGVKSSVLRNFRTEDLVVTSTK
jgi:hypothetical protein